MSLHQFLGASEASGKSLVVVNRTEPDQIQAMLESVFAEQQIDIEEREMPDGDANNVLLVENDEIVASSSLKELQESILLINSDLFITGARGLKDINPPDVLTKLDEIEFHLRGYPEAHSEKLLLILISRMIERLAWNRQDGRIRASFQRLKRIDDEVGTHQVYQKLDRSPVDVHVYGMPGWEPSPASTITAHAGYEQDFRESWFVVYTPPTNGDEYAALLALEDGPNTWDGFWTYDSSMVTAIEEYVSRRL